MRFFKIFAERNPKVIYIPLIFFMLFVGSLSHAQNLESLITAQERIDSAAKSLDSLYKEIKGRVYDADESYITSTSTKLKQYPIKLNPLIQELNKLQVPRSEAGNNQAALLQASVESLKMNYTASQNTLSLANDYLQKRQMSDFTKSIIKELLKQSILGYIPFFIK